MPTSDEQPRSDGRRLGALEDATDAFTAFSQSPSPSPLPLPLPLPIALVVAADASALETSVFYSSWAGFEENEPLVRQECRSPRLGGEVAALDTAPRRTAQQLAQDGETCKPPQSQ